MTYEEIKNSLARELSRRGQRTEESTLSKLTVALSADRPGPTEGEISAAVAGYLAVLENTHSKKENEGP